MTDLTTLPKFTSIDLTWSAPQEPNGVIISYEVTYRVTGNNVVTTNTTDLSTTFSISSLTPQTTVSDISVSAYTSIGPGEAATIADQTTLEEPREFLVAQEYIDNGGNRGLQHFSCKNYDLNTLILLPMPYLPL